VQVWRRRCARTRGVGQALLGLVLALGEYMDGAGRCGVSNARLAEDCEVSVRTVQRQLHQLHALGLLGVDQAPGGHAVNRYQARPWGDTGVTPRHDTGVTPDSSEGRHQWRDPMTPVSPEVEVQKVKNRAGANGPAPDGWVPEDDAAIAAEFAARAAAREDQARGEGEGWARPEALTEVRHAAHQFREALRRESEADARRRQGDA